MAGLSALRKGDSSVEEKILEHESSGQFSDAASYYNLAIKKEPNKLAHYEVGGGGKGWVRGEEGVQDVCRCGWMEAGRMEGGWRWGGNDRGAEGGTYI